MATGTGDWLIARLGPPSEWNHQPPTLRDGVKGHGKSWANPSRRGCHAANPQEPHHPPKSCLTISEHQWLDQYLSKGTTIEHIPPTAPPPENIAYVWLDYLASSLERRRQNNSTSHPGPKSTVRPCAPWSMSFSACISSSGSFRTARLASIRSVGRTVSYPWNQDG